MKRALVRKANLFRRVFGTPDGQRVIKHLEDEFLKEDYRGSTNEETHFNLGARDPIKYINKLLEYDNVEESVYTKIEL